MASRNADRPAHGLRIFFDRDGCGTWAWTVGPPVDDLEGRRPSDEESELLEALEGERPETGRRMWVAADDDALADEYWLLVGSCASGDPEVLRELVLRRMRLALPAPNRWTFDARWAARLAVYLGVEASSRNEWDVEPEHKALLQDVMWETPVRNPLLRTVFNRSLELSDLEARRQEECKELRANPPYADPWDPTPPKPPDVRRLTGLRPMTFSRRGRVVDISGGRGRGSYGSRGGG